MSVAVEQYLRTSEYGIVAAAALLAFDLCLTFEQETEWVYGTKWSAARIHFTCSRYLPFVAIMMAIETSRARPSGSNYCGTLGTITSIFYYLCIVLAEAMLIVRTYAFWNRSRKILIGVCTLGVSCLILSIVPAETIASKPTNAVYKALDCVGVESTAATAIQFICLIIYEMGILGLNWIAFRNMKRYSPPGRLITTLYFDGITYVAVILVFSVLNAVVTLSAPVQNSDILNSPQMVMHSILASRIFFNLRETTRRQQAITLPMALSEFRAPQQISSSGFSSSLGTSSSSSGFDPTKTIEISRGVESPRKRVVQG